VEKIREKVGGRINVGSSDKCVLREV
jgi:hypothetical protein